MRVIELEKNLEMPDINISANKHYACENEQLWQVAANVQGQLACRPLMKEDFFQFQGKETIKDTVLIVRSGAAGDLVFMKPAVQALMDKGKKVTTTPMDRFWWIYDTFEGVNRIKFPVEMTDEIRKFEAVYVLENIGERGRGSNTVDLFAKAVGVYPLANRKPSYSPKPEVLSKVDTMFKRTKKRIGFNIKSTSAVRDYPETLFQRVVADLFKMGHEIAFIGAKGSITSNEEFDKHCINLTKTDLTWEEQVAFIKTCDVFVGLDSGNTHLAGAMDVPTVALYGSFHWKDRSEVFPSVKAIQAHSGCDKAPCYHHPNMIPFPVGAPCWNKNRCESLASIEPERVVAEVKKML